MASLAAPDLAAPARRTARAIPLALLAWALCCLGMLWLFRGDFAALAFRDPDDAMRLQQVRDWMGGQAFWDVAQHRVNPPLGGPMHWSRIVDMPVAAMILLARPLVGAAQAEIVAAVPLLLLGGLALALNRAAGLIGDRKQALVALALLLTAPSILVQFTPLRIDHHGWQILMAAIALCGVLDDKQARGGAVAGLALAVWLQISSEGLPYAALIGGTFGSGSTAGKRRVSSPMPGHWAGRRCRCCWRSRDRRPCSGSNATRCRPSMSGRCWLLPW
jgi:hypothetical protein